MSQKQTANAQDSVGKAI